MYICVCHAVTDHDIAQAFARGARSVRDLHKSTGLGTTCGRCAQCARACLQQTAQAGVPAREDTPLATAA